VFGSFLSSLTTLCVCLLFGYAGRKFKVLTDESNAAMSRVLVSIALPCMVFISLMQPFSRELLAECAASFGLFFLIFLVGLPIGTLFARLLKANDGEKRVWQFSLVFANVGYMGFPITQTVFGDGSLIYTSMGNAAFHVLAFSLGVYLFNPGDGFTKANLARIALNPALIATYIGFAFFVGGLRLPQTVESGVAFVGNMTTPLSMLLVGSVLAKNPLRTLVNDIRVAPLVLTRLLIIPVAAFFLLRPFIPNITMLGVIVSLSAMPVASLTVIFAERYGGDAAHASKLVALSTVCCLISIPVISLLLEGLT
jgi:predicted permease